MNKKVSVLILIVLSITLLVACKKDKEDRVVIYSSGYDYENEYYLKRLQEEFPDYEIIIEYLNTGTHAAKLKAEGTNTECDITIGLEYQYLDVIKDNLADLSSYDYSAFLPELIDDDYKYLPALRNGCSIILHMDMLKEKGLEEPKSYKDLLKEEYKGLISMPNPKSSGTGYVFLKSLVNAWGEDKAFEYFEQLGKNVLQFTSSGSGPINSLIQGEAAIALGMTSQAVKSINDGVNLKIVFFEEGSPYNAYGNGIIKGREERQAVKKVFDFFYNHLIEENNDKFYPEVIYKNKTITMENYPKDIIYSDMGNDSPGNRERLLEKWIY